MMLHDMISGPNRWNLISMTDMLPQLYAPECGAYQKNPPAPKVLGRDLPDGTRKRLQVYLGGGVAFFGQNLLFLIGRDARLQKTL